MDYSLKMFEEFLISKGVNKEEVKPYLIQIKKELKNKKYGLIWEEKDENVYQELLKKLPVLQEVKDKEIKTDKNKMTNLLIEGDNLHSLKSLQFTHRSKCSLIYIDPPYNTGNKDFKYNDNFVDKEDNWRHSKWLSFMNKRLKLAKELLTDNGILFISIDDNEQAQLKLLCDEIFGEQNFMATIHWRKNRKPHNAGNTMSISHEFIHVYCKQNKIKLIQEFSRMKNDDKGNYTIYPILQGDKKERIYTFPKGTVCECSNLKKGIIKAKNNELLNIEILDDVEVKDNKLQKDIKIKGRYRLTDESGRLSTAILNNNIFINVNGFPKEKRYRTEKDFKVDNHYWDLDKGKNEDANDTIKNIFKKTNNNIFSYPKPVVLLKKILTCINNKNAIVVDFFAGSGTTGHAVLELNKEDGGNRQFILCTNNENNICEEVTYERLNKVINGYTTIKGEEIEGIRGNLKYYKVKLEEDYEDINENIENLIDKCTSLISIKENCFEFLESNLKYDIVANEDRVVLIYKNYLALDYEVEEIADKLLNYEHKNKVIYTTNPNVLINGIELKEYPVEIIEQLKILKRR